MPPISVTKSRRLMGFPQGQGLQTVRPATVSNAMKTDYACRPTWIIPRRTYGHDRRWRQCWGWSSVTIMF